MKYFKNILVILMVLSSCKTAKNVIEGNSIAKKMSARRVVNKHISAHFDKKTIDAKLKVNFDNGTTKLGLRVSLRIQKDSVIYIKATKGITLFKTEITPASVRYYSPHNKDYFEGDFSMIAKLLGFSVNFKQLQNLLLGQALQNLKDEKQTVRIENNSYIISPEKQAALFDIFFLMNANHYKLDKQFIVNSIKEQRLDIIYQSYNLVDKTVFPLEINLISKQKKAVTTIDLVFKSVVFDAKLTMPFSIPKKYKKIQF